MSMVKMLRFRSAFCAIHVVKTSLRNIPVGYTCALLNTMQRSTYRPYIHAVQSLNSSYALTPPSSLRFDKVPEKLPDWWDDEDDDEHDDDEARPGGGEGNSGGESGGGRGSGNGGGGGGDGDHNDRDNRGNKSGMFAALLAIYIKAIETAPVRTKAVSTCLLAIIGDAIAQFIARDQNGFTFNARRSASIGIWGICFMGPVLHYWYGLLDILFSGKFSVLAKLLSDQIFFAPFFNGAFIAGVGTLEGQSSSDVSEAVKTKLWPAMKANWTLWPVAQFVNFAIIPKTFQIVYVNCIALVWNAILTYISHQKKEEVHASSSSTYI